MIKSSTTLLQKLKSLIFLQFMKISQWHEVNCTPGFGNLLQTGLPSLPFHPSIYFVAWIRSQCQ